MAISPKMLNNAFNEEIDIFEVKIEDQLILKTLVLNGSISVDNPTGMSRDHFTVLRQRYIAAGWKDVKENHDQRQGSWLTFHS